MFFGFFVVVDVVAVAVAVVSLMSMIFGYMWNSLNLSRSFNPNEFLAYLFFPKQVAES